MRFAEKEYLVSTKPAIMLHQLSKRLLNTEEYHRMAEAGILGEDDRVELIHGEILEMSPIGSEHAGCINRLNRLFGALLGGSAVISVQNPLLLDERSEPQPDLAILRPDPYFYSQRHPTAADVILLIEIADSSLAYDREVKLPLYAEAGIPEYWLIDLQASEVEVYRQPKGTSYGSKKTVTAGQTIRLGSLDVSLKAEDMLG